MDYRNNRALVALASKVVEMKAEVAATKTARINVDMIIKHVVKTTIEIDPEIDAADLTDDIGRYLARND